MEKYDPQMAQRVWNRVWAEPEQPQEGLGHLMICQVQAAADYTALQRRFPEIKTLLENTRRHIACLRGIRYLTEGRRPDPIPAKPRSEAPDTALRRCISQCIKAAAACQAHSGDPEYGFCFARMADETRQHCRTLLELLGNMEHKHK